MALQTGDRVVAARGIRVPAPPPPRPLAPRPAAAELAPPYPRPAGITGSTASRAPAAGPGPPRASAVSGVAAWPAAGTGDQRVCQPDEEDQDGDHDDPHQAGPPGWPAGSVSGHHGGHLPPGPAIPRRALVSAAMPRGECRPASDRSGTSWRPPPPGPGPPGPAPGAAATPRGTVPPVLCPFRGSGRPYGVMTM